jgi:hypothetical protein
LDQYFKCSFLGTFDPKWAADRTIVLLLMCIALFNPSCAGINDAPMVTGANTTYTTLLHMYGLRAAPKLLCPYIHTDTYTKSCTLSHSQSM